MEKALHDYFYINTGNEIKLYNERESSFLIEAANFHINRETSNNSSKIMSDINAFIYNCMDEYYKNGASEYLLNKLNQMLRHVPVQCLVEEIERKIKAVHAAYMPPNQDPLVFAAYMFSNITSFGGLNELRRCNNEKCLKFFIGKSNKRWCTSSCGSKYRVRKMRQAQGR